MCLGPGILTSQQAGTAVQSYPVSLFLSHFHVDTGSYGRGSITWHGCPGCMEIVAIILTLLWNTWQTCPSCVLSKV